MTEMPLDKFLTTVKPGDEWGWGIEIALLIRNHSERVEALVRDISRQGIHTPILIGTDGRCWDGHHRITAAFLLGLQTIPVTYAEQDAASC